MLQLFEHLKDNGFTQLSRRRLCQDNLEQFFRRGTGNAQTVTATIFECLFQKRWGINYTNTVSKGNCQLITEDETSKTVSNTKTSIFNNTIENSDNNFPLVENISDPEEIILNSELDQQIFLGENAFTYVCGYLFKKLR